MLEVAAVDFDHDKVQILVRQPCTLVFYSRNSVETVRESGVLDDIDLIEHTVWAVGEKTAEAVSEQFGLEAKVPADERFEGLIEEFLESPPPSPVVAFSLKDSPRNLAARLHDVADVHEIPVYHTCAKLYPRLADELTEIGADWVAFTSPRGVRTFVTQASRVDLGKLRFAAIGPTTAEAMRDVGLEVDLVMEVPDKEEMMHKILILAKSDR